jgi:nucleotide-binding universal stress UspA family protein
MRFVPPHQEEKIMFKKILVPLDGSDLAGKILPQIEELAKQVKAQVILLEVGSSDICAGGDAPVKPVKEGDSCPELPVGTYLEQTASKLRAQGVEATWVYKKGNPAKEIVAYAAGNDIDLIAIASHGGGEIAWLLGGVAHKVVTHASVPVLLWRVAEPKPPELKSELYYSMQTP